MKERLIRLAALDNCSMKVVAPVPYYPSLPIGWRKVYSQIARQETIEGVQIFHPRYFMTPKVLMNMYGFMMYLSVLPMIKKIQKEFDFDIIDAHYVYPDGLAAVLLGQYFNKPVIISARGSDINQYKDFPIIRRILKYTLTRADRVISVCQALKDEIIRLEVPETKISVNPNGVDTNKFTPLPKKEAREKTGLPMDRTIILSVGSLITRKGFDLLIRALKIVIDKFNEKNLYLVIVGEGEERSELERLIFSLNLENHVFLAGAVQHSELSKWYSAADLFCLASSREGWPNVIMESLACGIPVVASDVWGIPEIICLEKLGILVKRSDRDIAEGIYRAMKTEWDSYEIIKYAKEHTWQRVAESVFKVFESTLNGRQ